MKHFLFDLRRVFSNWGTVALCAVTPLVVTLVFALIAVPMFLAASVTAFNVMICDEDGSEPVKEFISQLVNSKALKDMVTVYPVKTSEQGIKLIQTGDATVFLHIPSHLFEDMQAQEPVVVDLYGAQGHALEVSIIRMALADSLEVVGKSENMLEIAYRAVRANGVSEAAGIDFFNSFLSDATTQYMSRRLVFGSEGTVSPVGDLLPVQYYLGAIFTLFAALAALPLAKKTAGDLSGAVLHRGLVSGRNAARFFLARLFSGWTFVLLVLLMLFPTGLALNALNRQVSAALVGNASALALAMAALALTFSAAATAFAALLPQGDHALWALFYAVIVTALCSGLIIPENALPGAIREIGRILPLSAGMHALSCALFRFSPEVYANALIGLVLWAAAFCAAGLWGYLRKERAA